MNLFLGHFVTLILCFVSTDVHGCAPPFIPPHPQQQYCASDFVFLGKVLSERLIDLNTDQGRLPGREYTLLVINRLKGRIARPGFNETIATTRDGGACGIRLDIDGIYLLGGYKESYGNKVWLQDLHISFSALTPKQLFYVFSRGPYSYRQNCNRCKVYLDDGNEVGDCKYGGGDCLKDAICRSDGGQCSWQNNNCK